MNNSDMQRNLYRILRMNIILAKSNGELVPEDTLQSFDEAARKIDDEDNLKYEENIKKLYYNTVTLEEEKTRLEKLIDNIDKRLEERKKLLTDYKETTNRDLEVLGYIKDEEQINDYKERLANINRYLSNKENILQTEEELALLHSELDTCYNNKKEDEKNNFSLEDDLLLTFKKIVTGSDYTDVLNATDIDFELEKIKSSVEEAKKTLNTFESAFNNLKKSGIALDSELEYSSYVDEARKAYYQIKEKEILCKIYKNIIESKNIYVELSEKRKHLDSILEERLNLREELGITDADLLSNLYTLIDKQNKDILKQKENIDRIGEIEEIIKYREGRLNELKEDNQKVEILSLLQEFGIIDVYEPQEIADVEEEKIEIEEEKEKEQKEIVTVPNMIVEIKDPYDQLNLSFARSKADTVMRRVGKSLGYAQETKKDTLVTFDFNNAEKDSNSNVTNSDINLDNNTNITDNDNYQNDVNNASLVSMANENINPVNVDMKESVSNNEMENIMPQNIEENEVNQIDNDFWSVNDDMFPTLGIDVNKDYVVDEVNNGFKLANPTDFGGNNENRN